MRRRGEFVAWLSDNERDKLDIAVRYYESELKLPANLAAKLRKDGMSDAMAKNLLANWIKSQNQK